MLMQRFMGLSTLPTIARSRTEPSKAAHVEEGRIPNFFSATAAQHQFCSARSQVRECCDDRLQKLIGGGTGVRVGHRPPWCPVGANAPNEGERYSVNVSSTVIRKRSYRRALRRLGAQGFAKYRGKTFYGRQNFGVDGQPHEKAVGGRRLRYATWNCGGLSSHLYAEVMYWAKTSAIDVLLLQETHWSNSMEWQDDTWCFVHSAASRCRSGGTLTCVRRDCVDATTLKWSELVPGRLLHVRGTIAGAPCDILNVYQKVRTAGSDEETQRTLAERATVWRQLQKCVRGLPYRDVIILAGDLNTILPRTSGLTGNSVGTENGRSRYVKEAAEAADMLLREGLVACNTYSECKPTYVHAMGESLLDYSFTRRTSADAEARRASVVDTPLAGWRVGGHKVLLGSVSLKWAPWRRRMQNTGCDLAPVLQDASTERLRAVRAAASEVEVSLAPRVQAPKLQSMEGTIVRYWESRAAFKGGDVRALKQCFDLLRSHGRMMRLHRELRQRARKRKRQRNLATLEMAEHAAKTGESRALFQCVKLLAGSKPSGRLRLRDESEGLVAAEKECEVLRQYAAELFRGEEYEPPSLQRIPEDWLDVWRWSKALAELKSGKAVPHGQPKIAAWKDPGNVFSEELSAISKLALCGSQPHVPVGWCSVQLAWLPKRPKPPTQPNHLRSVGLTPGDSKAFLLVLKEHLSESVYAALGDTPQFAYRKGMDTHNAILRATRHCYGVRTLLQQSRQDHTSRVAGGARCRLAGGMAISLDLAKAFDSVPHIEIQRSLEELQIDPRLIAIVMRVHTQTQCRIRQAGREATTMMTRGLWQGCPLAPVLYAAWASRLCRIVDDRLGAGWCNQRSIFADDTLGYWVIRGTGDMRRAIRELGCLFSVIRQLGLLINFDKSGVLLALPGTDKASMLRACTCQWRGLHQLRVPSEGLTEYVPIVSELNYLGIVLGYSGYEHATVQHRLGKSQQRFGQLSKVLRTRSSFGLLGRLRVYRSCVWSSMRYGLAAVGLAQAYNEIVSALCVRLRKVLRIYVRGLQRRGPE